MNTSALETTLSGLAADLLAHHPVRGLTWGIVHRGEVLSTGALGVADAAQGVAAGPAVASRICSITKTMTAISVMQLVEDGRITLDDPVNQHLTDFRIDHPDADAPAITIRHLLTHTAGIGDIHRVRDLRRPYAGYAVKAGNPVPTLRELYGPWFRTEVHAGLKWNYANHGFAILGHMVAGLRGQPYGAVLRERMFNPLGMDHTDIARSERAAAHFVGYRSATSLSRRRPRPQTDIDMTVVPTGGIWSTIEDLLRYATELLAPRHVVQPATIASMVQPAFEIDPRIPGRGLGFRIGSLAGHPAFGHDGAIPAWTSTLQVLPDDGFAFVAMANANTPAIGAAVHRFGIDAASAVLDLPSPEADVEAHRVPLDESVANELVGRWEVGPGLLTSVRMLMTGGRSVRVVRHPSGHLEVRTRMGTYGGGVELVPVDAADPLRFDALTRGLVSSFAFTRGSTGTVDRLVANDIDGPLELFRA